MQDSSFLPKDHLHKTFYTLKPPDTDFSDSLFAHANVKRHQFFSYLSPAEFLLDDGMNGHDVQQDLVADVSKFFPMLKHRGFESLLPHNW